MSRPRGSVSAKSEGLKYAYEFKSNHPEGRPRDGISENSVKKRYVTQHKFSTILQTLLILKEGRGGDGVPTLDICPITISIAWHKGRQSRRQSFHIKQYRILSAPQQAKRRADGLMVGFRQLWWNNWALRRRRRQRPPPRR